MSAFFTVGVLAAILVGWLIPVRGRFDLNLVPDLLSSGVFLLSLCALALVRQRRFAIPPTASLAFGGLFVCALMSLGYGVAPYKDVALHGPLALVLAWLAALAGYAFGEQPHVARLTAKGVLLGATLTAVTVYQQAGLRLIPVDWVVSIPLGETPVGNFFQPNLSALAMALGWLAALQLAGSPTARAGRWLLLPLALVLFIAVCLTGSRAGLLLLVLGSLFGAWTWPATPRDRLVIGAACLAAIVFAYVCGPIVAHQLTPAAPSNNAAMAIARLASGEGFYLRLAIMQQGVLQWREHPLLGGGWGSHAGWVFDHAGEFDYPRYSTNTHNIVTQLLGELGGVGFSVCLLAVILLASRVRASMQGPWAGWLLLLLVHSLLEYPLWNVSFLLLFAWSWGAAEAPAPALRSASLPAWVVASLAAFGLIVTLWIGRGLNRILDAQTSGGSGMVASYPLLSAYTDVMLFNGLPISEDRVAEKIQLGERVLHYAPQDRLIERQVLLLALAGDYERADVYRNRLLRMYYWRAEEIRARIEPAINDIRQIRARSGRR